jgi:hypothetical protein
MKKESGLTDAQILEEILNALDYNPNSFNKKLEYNSASTIPHILKGRNSLSRGIKERIVNTFPNVNMNFLKSGQLPILLTGGDLQAQANLLNITLQKTQTTGALIDLNKLSGIPEQLDRIEGMLKKLLDIKKGPAE